MVCNIKNNQLDLQRCVPNIIGFIMMLLLNVNVHAQDRTATLKIAFSNTDSTKTCTVTCLNDSGLPAKEKDIHLYVKSLYALLPVGKVVATDDNGEAAISFPTDLPGDKNKMITVIAKLEHDDVFANAETQAAVKWGATPKIENVHLSNRSLSASREHAPMYLVVASCLLIIVIWGTIMYVVYQLVRIKKAAGTRKQLNVAV